MNKNLAFGQEWPSRKSVLNNQVNEKPEIYLGEKQIDEYRLRLSEDRYMDTAIQKIAMELLHFLVKEK